MTDKTIINTSAVIDLIFVFTWKGNELKIKPHFLII